MRPLGFIFLCALLLAAVSACGSDSGAPAAPPPTDFGYVKASNTGAGDNFGFGVALSGDGNTLAVGAFREKSATTGVDTTPNDDGTANDSGAVYVFTRTGAVWSQQGYLKASNTDRGDWFGINVALSGDGNTLAVGAAGEDSAATGVGGDQADNTATDAGAVYLY